MGVAVKEDGLRTLKFKAEEQGEEKEGMREPLGATSKCIELVELEEHKTFMGQSETLICKLRTVFGGEAMEKYLIVVLEEMEVEMEKKAFGKLRPTTMALRAMRRGKEEQEERQMAAAAALAAAAGGGTAVAGGAKKAKAGRCRGPLGGRRKEGAAGG